MHWVYVIKSSKTGKIYVGETMRLYSRWNEHQTGRGGVNTSMDEYDTLVGLYNVGNNTSFVTHNTDLINGIFNWKCWFYWGSNECKGNACIIENSITEHLMLKNKEHIGKVRGGKYTTHERCINFYCKYLEDDKYLTFNKIRPFCKCGIPCEVNLTKDKSKIYFNCPLTRPVNWDDRGFFRGIHLPNKCDYYEEFEPYRLSKETYEKKRSERCKKQAEWWVKKLPVDEDKCIKCGKDDFEYFWNPDNECYSVCEECFHLHYEELKKEYQDKPLDSSHIFSIIKY